MIKVAIVDDEEIFANKLKQDISDIFKSKNIQYQIGVYTDSTKVISAHKDNSFNLIFLDIDMPKKNGMEIAAEIRNIETKTYLIFVSAYSNFVFETFQFSPFRFIRKERLKSELPDAINAYCDEVCKEKQLVPIQLEDKSIKNYDATKYIYFFSLRHDIFLYLSADKQIRLANRVYTMDKLEEMFSKYGFIRVHKSYLINYRYIYQIKNNVVYVLPDSKTSVISIPLSGRRAAKVKLQYQLLTRGDDSL